MNQKKKTINVKVFFKRCLLCLLVMYMFGLFIAQQVNFARLSKEDKALSSQIAQAEQENKALTEEKEAARTPAYMERVARDKLGYMKPEEKVFIDAKK